MSQALRSFLSELRVVLARGREVWKMVSPARRRVFIFATLLMTLASAANLGTQLWLGGMVDSMRGVQTPDTAARLPRLVGEKFGYVAPYEWREIRAQQPAAPGTSAVAKPAQDKLLPSNVLGPVVVCFLAGIALAFLFRECLRVGLRFLVQNAVTRIEKEITVDLVSHLMRVDLNKLSKERVGALHGRIHRSVEGFVRFLKLGFLDFFPAIATAALALLAAFSKQSLVGLIMLGVIPLSLAIVLKQIASQKGVRMTLMRKKEALDGTVVEQLSGMEYIRAANTHDLEIKRVSAVAEERREQGLRHHLTNSFYDCIKALNEGFWLIFVITTAIYLAAAEKISIGDILVFSTLYMSVMTPLREIHRIMDDAHESSLQVADLMALRALPTDDSFSLPTLHHPHVKLGEPIIAVQDLCVDFSLADGEKRRVLHGVSMKILHGETIGVAGPSGSGKSTWLKIVMRLIHPAAGEVYLGGEPIQSISRETIGKLIGYASQTPFIFAGTIKQNIAYGSEGANDEAIRSAAEAACIHDEIMALPAGYDSPVTERGNNLSGGQRQRLAIARIFLKNPPILVLDEGTSALDNISERRVQQAIAAARKDRTIIMIAHRLTTLRDATRIYVFDQGHIVETGTYDELFHQGRLFTQLVKSAEGAS